MAKATWKCHTCDTETRCTGRNRSEADRIAAWHESEKHTCNDCQVEARKQHSENLLAESVASGLPELTGTEPQRHWAVTIRADKLSKLDDAIENIDPAHPNYGYLIQSAEQLQQTQQAHWWIDNRDKTASELLQALAIILSEKDKPPSFEHELSAAATITPKSSRFNTPAEIKQHSDSISVHFPIKDDTAREVLLHLGYYWNKTHWQCDLNETTGHPSDRVAETGHRLLNERIPVLIWNEQTRLDAVSGNYSPLTTQWIVNLPKKKRFGIRWNRWKDADWYATVKQIRTSRWSKPYVTVMYSEFEEVQGFAEVNGFEITDAARVVISKMESTKLQSLIEEVSPVKEVVASKRDREKLKVGDSCVIDPELMDD